MCKQVFVIIDPQNDFTSPEGNYAKRHPGIAKIITAKENINKLILSRDKKDFIVLQSDYHPDQFEKGLSLCIRGTIGHQIDKVLQLDEDFLLFRKTEHSAFSSQRFITHIQDKRIRTLVLCGFLAEYCVKKTATDALEAGYAVVLLEDCIGTGDDVQDRKREMLQLLKGKGAEVKSADAYRLR